MAKPGLVSRSDVIRTIRDPEKPNTLEELDVVTEKCVEVQELGEEEYLIIIRFSPTVPHCSLATLIGDPPAPALSCCCHVRRSRSDGVFVCRSLPPGEAAAVFALQAQGEQKPSTHLPGRVCRAHCLAVSVSSAGNLHF